MLGKLRAHLDEKGIRLTFSDDVLAHISEKSFSEKFGARNMRRFIEREVEDRIASLIIDSGDKALLGIHLTVKDDKIEINSI